MQYGLKVANYPLTEDDLDDDHLLTRCENISLNYLD